jgi:hypothetical protein
MCNIDPIQIQPILWKIGHAKGKSLTGEGGWKKEANKVNIVDVLSIQEWILKPVEIIIRRGVRQKGAYTWKCHNEIPCVAILNKQKFLVKNGGQEGKIGPVWGLAPMWEGEYKERM